MPLVRALSFSLSLFLSFTVSLVCFLFAVFRHSWEVEQSVHAELREKHFPPI